MDRSGWLSWTMSVVVAGVAVNVLSHYLQRWLDRGQGSAGRWLANRTTARRAARTARIEAAKSDSRSLDELRFRALAYRLDGIMFLLASGLLAIMSVASGLIVVLTPGSALGAQIIMYLATGGSLIAMFIGGQAWTRGVERSEEAGEARRATKE